MELIDQRTKKIMEECKVRARDQGLKFDDNTLEYIVTNNDMVELSPKVMIPTLYDYWVNDVELLKGKGKYELSPHNPYETVINTRPAVSFYNDNNPDWLNVMIFYHVLGHIDFFQNNQFFQNTWDDDFMGRALADKRHLKNLRNDLGSRRRFVDYAIEFSRGMDNLVGWLDDIAFRNTPKDSNISEKAEYYFDFFLPQKKVSFNKMQDELNRYKKIKKNIPTDIDSIFFADIALENPEFNALYEKEFKGSRNQPKKLDLMQYIVDNSKYLALKENEWMKSVLNIVRDTSMYFSPQIRTKIMNEGWASYWHDKLFMMDDRIKGNEVNYAKINSAVTSMPRGGLNPYALGLRMFWHLEDYANKGRLSLEYARLTDREERNKFDKNTNKGMDYIFKIREDHNDFTFINQFISQDMVDKYKLFVMGKRPNFDNPQQPYWEYFIKSKNAQDYKNMLVDTLYHPPKIEIKEEYMNEGALYLNHKFEGKQLVQEWIKHTMLGIEYLWRKPIYLETSVVDPIALKQEKKIRYKRVIYTYQRDAENKPKFGIIPYDDFKKYASQNFD